MRWLMSPQEDAKAAIQIGDLPTVKSAVSTALPQEDPVQMKAFETELDNGGTERTEYAGTAFNSVSVTIGNAIDAAVLGQQTPQQALRSIAGTVSSSLHGGSGS
jgi:ABC-type glycerol-3-phosphate transport system substrate-binding protein